MRADEARGEGGRRVGQIVLFSGGRDSTLVASRLLDAGREVHLLSFESGLGFNGAEMRQLRVNEMQTVWGPDSFSHVTIRNYGLVRKICFESIVEDVLEDGCQLILLGEFLAMLGAALVYAKRLAGPSVINTGAVTYQSHYPEQHPGAIKKFEEICAVHAVEFAAPIYDVKNSDDIGIELMMAGLSPKSLEGTSLLSYLSDDPPAAAVLSYIERKSSILHSHCRAMRRPE